MEERIYGKWGGNPQGVKEDTQKCIASIWSAYVNHQCPRPRGHGKDGLYCKQHDPETVAQKRKALEDKCKASVEASVKQSDKQRRINAAHEPMLAALENIVAVFDNGVQNNALEDKAMLNARAAIKIAKGEK